MKSLLSIVGAALLIGIGLISVAKPAGYRNLDETKAHAVETFRAAGFEVIGYERYEWDPILGAEVWYIVKQPNEPTIYHGFLCKWGNEYHIYNLKAINAITQNQ